MRPSGMLRSAIAAALFLGAASARADEINLIFATGSPAGSEVSEEFFRPFAEKLNAAGKGVLHVDFREGSAISDPAKAYDRITSDAIQIGFMLPNLVAGKFPRTQVVTLPYIAGDISEYSSRALWRVYEHGPLAKEYDQVRVLAISTISQASIHMLKALPSRMALAGNKIMVTSKTAADVITRLGGAPISLPPFQVYEALMRHTVDGTVTGWPSFQPFKLIEVTTYHIDAPIGSSIAVVFMAKAKYNSLPEAARKIIDANSGEQASREFGRMWDIVAERARQLIKKTPGQRLVAPTDAEADEIRKKTAPVVDDWLAATPDGKETLDQFNAALAAVELTHERDPSRTGK
ncbi:MAG TPA: TRAP transporter substrate-binding protein [Stellaceae bacterium]|nr:TRAP transporter substrate-binding protein [Stellaceae bacterium]